MMAFSRMSVLLKRWRTNWVVIVVGGVVSLNLFSSTAQGMLHEWIGKGFPNPFLQSLNWADLGMLFGSLTFAVLIYRRGVSRSTLSVVEMREARFAEGIILYLSSLLPVTYSRFKETVGKDLGKSEKLDLLLRPTVEIAQTLTELENIELGGARLPWITALVAISHHLQLAQAGGRKLKRVAVITSQGSKSAAGSKDQFELFRSFLTALIRESAMCPEIACYPTGSNTGIDFENYEAISQVTRQAIEDMAKVTNNFVIDVTGGTKPCSIVAGIFSLEDIRRLQYVSTSRLVAQEADLRYQRQNSEVTD